MSALLNASAGSAKPLPYRKHRHNEMAAMRGEQQKRPIAARDPEGTLYRAGESVRIRGS